MTTAKKSIIALELIAMLVLSVRIRAQTPLPTIKGQNAVVQSSSNGTVTAINSPAFVDASIYNTDICTSIADVLANWSSGNSNGIVVDARGVSSLDCTGSSSKNPWAGLSGNGFINTVLLPAGTIKIYQTWIPISDTRIVGEGPNLTTLEAASNLTANGGDGDMVDMGGPQVGTVFPCVQQGAFSDCTGLVIEHLGLNGGASSGFNVNGIGNNFSEELSYVNDVVLTNITGTGLSLGVSCPGNSCIGYSSNSGPYSNISYTGTGACLNIAEKNPTEGTNSLRGVHGLTCSTSNNPAIYLDGSNTTMEDITIVGSSSTQDGILVGSNTSAAARADALRNIRSGGTLRYLIHLSNAPVGQPPDVSDVTVLGASQGLGTSLTATIQDDLTGTTLSDANVSMYVLGEPLTVGNGTGYSRFTTSPDIPTWLTGTTSLGSTSSCSAAGTGSLYTCTNSTNCSTTLWACTSQKWIPIK